MLSTPTTVGQIDAWRAAKSETENLEFKEAKTQFDFKTLLSYCVALANERGGILLLGIADKPPRPVVGTSAYPNIAKTTRDILNNLHFRVDVEEVQHPEGRVLVFHIPSRPIGHPYELDGSYYMRSGESLVAMTPDQLKQIFGEGGTERSRSIERSRRSHLRLGVLALIAGVLVSICFQANRIRHEQKIMATEGDLSNCEFFSFGCGEAGLRMLQFGDSGGTLVYGGPADEPMIQLAYDSGIQVDSGQRGPELTTTVRDKDGKIVVHIDKNHWTVFPPFYSDKNYTRDALEVKDGRGHVVLWVRLLKDRVQIQGEWRDEFGHGRRWRRCPKPRDACIDLWDNPREELANEHLIEPMFEYPSKEHIGEARKVWPLHD